MDEDGLLQLAGQLELPLEDVLLGAGFAKVPLVVEPARPDGHTLGRTRNHLELVPRAGLLDDGLGVVRVDAGRRVDDSGVDTRQPQGLLARLDRRARDHDLLDACEGGRRRKTEAVRTLFGIEKVLGGFIFRQRASKHRRPCL